MLVKQVQRTPWVFKFAWLHSLSTLRSHEHHKMKESGLLGKKDRPTSCSCRWWRIQLEWMLDLPSRNPLKSNTRPPPKKNAEQMVTKVHLRKYPRKKYHKGVFNHPKTFHFFPQKQQQRKATVAGTGGNLLKKNGVPTPPPEKKS